MIVQAVKKVFLEAVEKNRGLFNCELLNLVAPIVEVIKELYRKVMGLDEHLVVHDRKIASIEATLADKAATDAKIKKLEAEYAQVKLESALRAHLDKIEKNT